MFFKGKRDAKPSSPARPVVVVHVTWKARPFALPGRRFFRVAQAKRIARMSDVKYVVLGEYRTRGPTRAFYDKHSKKSGLLKPVEGTTNVFVLDPAKTGSKRNPTSRTAKKSGLRR